MGGGGTLLTLLTPIPTLCFLSLLHFAGKLKSCLLPTPTMFSHSLESILLSHLPPHFIITVLAKIVNASMLLNAIVTKCILLDLSVLQMKDYLVNVLQNNTKTYRKGMSLYCACLCVPERRKGWEKKGLLFFKKLQVFQNFRSMGT